MIRIRTAAAVVLAAVSSVFAQPCSPGWSDVFATGDTPETVRAFIDAPVAGARWLIAGGEGGSWTDGWVARWTGTRWDYIGGFSGESEHGQAFPGVYSLETFNAGGGAALYAGGDYTFVDNAPVSCIARWTGTGWTSVGGGTNGLIRALRAFDDGSGPRLFACGFFTEAGGQPASGIAQWDGATWQSVGGGLGAGTIPEGAPLGYAMAVHNDGSGPALYVGGRFGAVGTLDVTRIARWRAGAWERVGNGLAGTTSDTNVLCLFEFDNDLYAGGRFVGSGTTPLQNVARWNGTAWESVGGGLGMTWVGALGSFADTSGDFLIAGGNPGAQPTSIYRLGTSAWAPLATTTGIIRAIQPFDHGAGKRLFVGGDLDSINGIVTSDAAVWDGNTWSRLGQSYCDGEITDAAALPIPAGPRLVVAGAFKRIGGVSARGLAMWDGTSWSDPGYPGTTPRQIAVLVEEGAPTIYAKESNNLYRWRDGVFTTFPAASVWEMAAHDDGAGSHLYAVDSEPGVTGQVVRRWTGNSWLTVSTPITVLNANYPNNRDLRSLRLGQESVLVYTGVANAAAGLSFNGIAGWTASGWRAFGSGLAPVVHFAPDAREVLDIPDGPLAGMYAMGGTLIWSPTLPRPVMMRWDGEEWITIIEQQLLEVGVTESISSAQRVQIDGDRLVVGGWFAAIEGVHAANLAQWDGNSWEPFGGGIGSSVNKVLLFNDGSGPALFVLGDFAVAGQRHSAGRIAKWQFCPCVADCNGDGSLTSADFGCFQTRFAQGSMLADCNGDALLNLSDFGCFMTKFAMGCP